MEVGVPNVFPIAPCHLISLAQITTLITYISSPKEKTTIYICCECPKFNHNFFCDGAIKDAHGKTKLKYSNFGSPGQLITNMNHSILSTNLCNHKPWGGGGGRQSCDNKWVLYILGGYSLICTQLILVFEDFLVELDIW
jgi:hypothetical protein